MRSTTSMGITAKRTYWVVLWPKRPEGVSRWFLERYLSLAQQTSLGIQSQ
jgi:hypothetical protein